MNRADPTSSLERESVHHLKVGEKVAVPGVESHCSQPKALETGASAVLLNPAEERHSTRTPRIAMPEIFQWNERLAVAVGYPLLHEGAED